MLGMICVCMCVFSKAYDKVGWDKLWSCLQSVGVKGEVFKVSAGVV